MTKISDFKLTSLEEILKEGAKNVSTDKLYWGLTNEAHQMEYEVEALADKTEAKARVLAEGLMNKNNTFEEALKELKRLNDLRNDITNEEIRQNITQILDITQSIIFKEMQQVRCDIRKFNNEDEAIKNTDRDNTMGIYKDGILVKGELKIQKQEQETEVVNYLPSANIKCNLAPEFIEQITKEVIKKMKEDHINFAEIKQPCKESEMNSNKVTSKTEGKILNKVEVSYLEAYKEIAEYLMKHKNIYLEKIYTDDVIKVMRIIKELKNIPCDRAISILNNCKTIIPCVSTVK